MKKTAAILPFVGLFCSFLTAYDYVYPLGEINYNGFHVLLALYQKTPDHTELWQWDPVTQEAARALLSTYTPVGVAFLPHNEGFSFFDNGRLRVKHYLKRSSKAIDIYEPIYDLGPLQWITSDLCIFHAKERGKFSIYQLSASSGLVECLVCSKTSDCFYPSQIGSSLFYIKHPKKDVPGVDQDGKELAEIRDYSIIRQSEDGLVKNQKIIVNHDKSLAFLSMTNEHEGIVIEHQADVDSHKDTLLMCTCYRLVCKNTQGRLIKLFSFSLPLSLLLPSSKARLAESIYPLLPRKVGEKIYFVTVIGDELKPCVYTEEQGVEALSFDSRPYGDLFTPYPMIIEGPGSKLVYGGSLQRALLFDTQEPVESLLIN